MNTQYDVIVVGAGMVGATLAAALAEQSTLKIALIEAHLPIPLDELEPPDLRVSALNRASETLLNNLNIWPHLLSNRIGQFRDMHVWESSHQHALHFNSASIGEPILGYIIENRHIQHACLARCRQLNNIDFICPAQLISANENNLSLDNGHTLTADLIVGADGAHSTLRQWHAIASRGWNYNQSAVVCTVSTEKPHQDTAWQRFLPGGPLAFLPLADPHQCSIVWSNTIDNAEALSQLDDNAFRHQLAHAFDHTLGEVTQASKRAQFPLSLRHADHYVEESFALVGDAAHTIHPLAGQGVNLGLLDAITLAEIVISAHSKGRNIGSLHTLNKYQRRRKADNIAMQFSMDILNRLFASTLGPVRSARDRGLYVVNQSELLKNLLMKHASGYRFAPLPASQKLHADNTN